MDNDVRLGLLQDAIADSGLDGRTKDALADDLRYAQEINGTEDPALLGIKRLVISGIRRELLAEDRVNDAVRKHSVQCPALASLGDALPTCVFSRWVRLLTPWRWPVAVGCFSPFAGDIISRVLTVFGK